MKKKIDITIPLLILLLLTAVFVLVRFWMLFDEVRMHLADRTELVAMGNSVLHNNDILIRTVNTYVLTEEPAYKFKYYELLNDYDTFSGKIDRMKEIGLTGEELAYIDRMMDAWDVLEQAEAEVFGAISRGDREAAIEGLISPGYLQADSVLVETITDFIESIEERSAETTYELNRQFEVVMLIFTVAFLAILIALGITFGKNNKLKEKYRRQKERAEFNSNAKSAFLANVSHEVRTPMNAILGVTEIQLLSGSLSPEVEDAFNKVYDSGNLLLNIINDILDLSKIEAGKLDIFPVKYDIPSLLNDALQLNRLRYETKTLEVRVEVDENTPLNVFGDELRIKQILNNILSNAYKYTDKGTISVSVWAEACDFGHPDNDVVLVFKVADTGQGMTEQQLDKLFDEYTRFSMDANRTTSGTGLGMSITKNLVKLLGGGIDVESEVGKGSVFTVRIPQKRLDDIVCGPDMAKRLQDFSFHSTAMSQKSSLLREYMPYGSVLIVDDVESNLFVARGLLIPYGLKIETVTSGMDAIKKIEEGNEYDIIFMDHMMPVMDGMEAVRLLREGGYKSTIVALTANAIVGQAEIFLKNGFDGYISKPIDSRELNAILNEFIRDKKPPEVVKAARWLHSTQKKEK